MGYDKLDKAFARHDHRRCIKGALADARRICNENNGRLTRQRLRALELVWQSHRPVGAYEILEQLRAEGFNGAPPTVYRALDFLLDQGLIHRIESLNAYTGCAYPGLQHSGQFLICSKCQRVAELDDPRVTSAISRTAARLGFVADSPVVEIRGLCPLCRERRADNDVQLRRR